jgi:hypothetical protein
LGLDLAPAAGPICTSFTNLQLSDFVCGWPLRLWCFA